MPGVGKSTIGVLLAKRLGRLFLDTDVLIQVACEKSLRQLIGEHGMSGFCQIEQDYVSCLDIQNAVIATGGSVVYYDTSMRALRDSGVIIYLELSLPELAARLGDLNARGVVLDPGQTLDALYAKRTPLYQQWADVTINLTGLNHDQAVDAVITALNY